MVIRCYYHIALFRKDPLSLPKVRVAPVQATKNSEAKSLDFESPLMGIFGFSPKREVPNKPRLNECCFLFKGLLIINYWWGQLQRNEMVKLNIPDLISLSYPK